MPLEGAEDNSDLGPGYAEPLAGERPQVAIPSQDGVRTVEIGRWRCFKCGYKIDVLERGDDPLWTPNKCESCERMTTWDHVGEVSEDIVRAAAKAQDLWKPPAAVNGDVTGLWDDVRAFIRTYWDTSDTDLYDGLTAYALSTWLRDNLTFVPHLMVMAKTTDGKTRLFNTLERVSYRAIVSVSTTPASMFRLIDAYDMSFFVSEYHGLSHEARRELDAIVRAGQKRGERVTRAEPAATGFDPTAFDPFSHIAIGTQFDPDDDIVNRCIQVQSQSANRDMPATFNEADATKLRNRLLGARFRYLESDAWQDAEDRAYAWLAERNIDGRTREKTLSLVTVAILFDKLEALEPFIDDIVTQDRLAASDSEDAIVVEIIVEAVKDQLGEQAVLSDGDPLSAVEIPLSHIAEQFEAKTGQEKSPRWVGHVRSRLGLDKKRKSDGTVIKDPNLGDKLEHLCDDLNLEYPGATDDTDDQPLNEPIDAQVIRTLETDRNAPHKRVRVEATVANHLTHDLETDVSPNRVSDRIDTLLEEGRLLSRRDGHIRLV